MQESNHNKLLGLGFGSYCLFTAGEKSAVKKIPFLLVTCMRGETDLSGNTLGQYDVGHNYAGGALMTSYCVPGHASVGSICLLRLFSLSVHIWHC